MRWWFPCLLALALAGPAAAQAVSDAASGLGLTAPPGYGASRLPPRGNNAVAYGVRRIEDRDTGCQVAFARAPGNAPFSQAELNEAARGEPWRSAARRTVSAAFELDRAEGFAHAGMQGLLMEGRPRQRDGMGEAARERAGQLRVFFVILETPLGRTSTVCIAEAVDFPVRQAEFLALVRATRPPGAPTP